MASIIRPLTTIAFIAVFAATEYHFSNKGWAVAPILFIATQLHFANSNYFLIKICKKLSFFLLVFQITTAWMEKTLISYCAFIVHTAILLIFGALWRPTGTLVNDSTDLLQIPLDDLTAMSFEDKIRLIYNIHDASMLSNVPDILEKYKGRETVLLDELGKKYGPISIKLVAEKLRQFYTTNNRLRQPGIASVLEKFKGRGFGLLDMFGLKESLTKQTCKAAVPLDDMSEITFEQKVRIYYRIHDPSMLPTVPEILEKHMGREAFFLKELEKTYGPITIKLVEEKLRQSYAVNSPSKLTNISSVLEKFKGQERASLGIQDQKESVTSLNNTVTAVAEHAHMSFGSLDDMPNMSYEDMVRLFYHIHNPTIVSAVPELLEKYKGREVFLLNKLEKKYGPMTSGLIEEKVRQFYAAHNPSKLSGISAILERYRGRESVLFDMLEKKYGIDSVEFNAL